MKENKNKFLIKNVILFSLSSFLPKLIVFLLVPLYTSKLTTDEFGIADLINTTTNLLIPIFSLDIQDAVLRYSMDKKYEKNEVMSATLKINIIGALLLSILLLLISRLSVFNLPNYFYIYICILFVLNSLRNSLVMFCKGINEVKKIVISSITLTLTTVVLNVLFLLVLNMGIHGYLLANVFGFILSNIYLFVSTRLFEYVDFKAKYTKTKKEMVKYSFPLIFSVIAWWINNASDRYILTWVLGLSISGIYAVAYKIPNIISTFYGVFSQAWSISAIKDYDKDDKDGFIGNIYMLLNTFLCIFCSILMICNVYISKLLFLGDFFQAWKYVPTLIYSILFYSNAMFIGNIFVAVKDTKYLSTSTIIGSVVNTIFNIILILLIGPLGAAISTLLGYFIIFIMRRIFVKKYININYNKKLLTIGFCMLFFQMIIATFGNKYIIIQCLILALLILLYKKNILLLINKSLLFIKSKLNKDKRKGTNK